MYYSNRPLDCVTQFKVNERNFRSGRWMASERVTPQQLKEQVHLMSERKNFSYEECCYIRQAVKELPEKQREVIEMLYWDGLDGREIAANLHVSLEEVRRLEDYAIGLLRKKYIKEISEFRMKQRKKVANF